MLSIIVFITAFLITVNWFQFISFSSLVIGKKIKTSSIKDKWIFDTVKKKTGLKLLDITLFHDNKMYGMMAGLPFWPKMILSTGIYESFNKDELEWVILHEAGHCVLWHNLQSFLIEMVVLFFGTFIIKAGKMGLLEVIPIYIILSVICIQIIRWSTEFIADKYSISRVDNPKGVITAQDKFRNNYKDNYMNSEKSLFRMLFHWNITPSKRIAMANVRINQMKLSYFTLLSR